LVMPQHHCLALEACLNFDSFGPDMVIWFRRYPVCVRSWF
jgi:hypothetical protein